MYKIVPTWNNGVWEETEFQTIEDFREFIDSIFKEPGKYNFDNTSFSEEVNPSEGGRGWPQSIPILLLIKVL